MTHTMNNYLVALFYMKLMDEISTYFGYPVSSREVLSACIFDVVYNISTYTKPTKVNTKNSPKTKDKVVSICFGVVVSDWFSEGGVVQPIYFMRSESVNETFDTRQQSTVKFLSQQIEVAGFHSAGYAKGVPKTSSLCKNCIPTIP